MIHRLALCLLLAGCAAAGGNTPEQACAREADDTPTVKELVIKGVGNPQFQWENGERLRLARRDATLACLQARGLAAKGGVERPRPR